MKQDRNVSDPLWGPALPSANRLRSQSICYLEAIAIPGLSTSSNSWRLYSTKEVWNCLPITAQYFVDRCLQKFAYTALTNSPCSRACFILNWGVMRAMFLFFSQAYHSFHIQGIFILTLTHGVNHLLFYTVLNCKWYF